MSSFETSAPMKVGMQVKPGDLRLADFFTGVAGKQVIEGGKLAANPSSQAGHAVCHAL